MNRLTKIIILTVYTLVLLAGAIFIVSKNSVTKGFEEYQTTPYNDDIALNVQMYETRTTASENESDYEYTKYDLKMIVRKNLNTSISNVYTFVCVESEDGYKYTETSSAKKLDKGTWYNSSFSLTNSTQEFAYRKVTKDDKGNVNFENFTPKTIYIKVAYDIEVVDEDGDEVIEDRTLNYKFDFKELTHEEYNKYEKREVTSGDIDCKEEFIKLKFSKTLKEVSSTNKNEKITYSFDKVELLEDKLPKDVSVEKINIIVDAEVLNKTSSSKYFSNYVRLFNYNGALQINKDIGTKRDCSLETSYGVEKLYFTIESLLSNGETVKTTFYIDVKDL